MTRVTSQISYAELEAVLDAACKYVATFRAADAVDTRGSDFAEKWYAAVAAHDVNRVALFALVDQLASRRTES